MSSRLGLWACRFPTSVGLALVAALASYFLIERPFLRLKDRARPAGAAAEQPLAPPSESGRRHTIRHR